MNLIKTLEKLKKVYQGDIEMLDFIADRLSKMPEYVNKRVQHIIYSNIHSSVDSRSNESVIFHLLELDKARNASHEVAIDACKRLNEICRLEGIEPICDIDVNDREQVANFASEVTITFFDNEQMYKRTEPKDLIDDMVVDNYRFDTSDKTFEYICKNAGIEYESEIEYNEADIER